ncbi:MAG: hypothetical protein WB948_10820, partial [Desulfobaccales bacterium]
MSKNELAIMEEIKFPFPASPPYRAATQAINSALKLMNWEGDENWRPSFHYEGKDLHITIHYGEPNKPGEMATFWDAVSHNLSVETADVLEILMNRIVELGDHSEIAGITLREIAA